MTQIQREDIFRAGVAAHKSRDYGKAGRLYSQFVKLNPGVPEAWEKLGILFGEIGNFAEAENCLRGVLRFPVQTHAERVLPRLPRKAATGAA